MQTQAISNGTKVIITDASGPHEFNVLNGKDGGEAATPVIGENGNWFINGQDTGKPSRGEQGPAGQDGKTPVKGVDYYTDQDKQEMVQAVIAALPVYNGEVE